MLLSSNKKVATLLALFAFTLAIPASADDIDPHLRRGVELRKEHRDLDALEEFQAAYRAAPSPAIRAQIALAEQALGQWIAAESDLEGALEADDPFILHNHEVLEQSLSFVRQHLGWLEIDSNVAGAEISVNGISVGRAPLAHPVRVVVGQAMVRVQSEGFVPAERAVPIEANDHAREHVELAPRPVVPELPLPTSTAPGAPATAPQVVPASRWAGIALTSAGALALGVGGVFGVMTLADKSARDQRCDAKQCDADGLSLDRQARRDALLATVGIASGVVVLGAGLSLLWVSRSQSATATGIRVAPSAGPREASLNVVGAW